MNPCDLIDNWDQIKDSSQGFTELADMINGQLEAWGFDQVNFSDQPPPGGFETPGEYISDTNTIHLDPDFLAESDVSDAMSVGLHEAVHAMHDQGDLGTGDRLFDEYEAGYMGGFLSEEAKEKCKKRPQSGWQPDEDYDFDVGGLEYPFQSTLTSAGKKAHDAMER